MKQFISSLAEVFEILAIVLISIYIIYGFIAQPFLVHGASMEPSFSSGDYLMVDEITYRFRDPVRGEVIVFRNPTDQTEFYIKRIIGLPGEYVVVDGGRVFIDGDEVDELYGLEPGGSGEYAVSLGKDEYFVMGDNRSHSFDSRSWGPLNGDLIVGVARLRFWPPGSFSALSN